MQEMSELEMLNAQFAAKVKRKNSVEIKRKNRMKQYTVLLVGMLVILAVLIYALSVSIKNRSDQSTPSKTSQEEQVLSEEAQQLLTQEEKEEWAQKEVDETGVFLDVQTNWTLEKSTKEIPLRLINPPYSAYCLKVKLYPKEEPQKVLYESELVQPGELVAKAALEGNLEAGSHEMVIHYSFYGDEKMEYLLGEYEVKGNLIVEQ